MELQSKEEHLNCYLYNRQEAIVLYLSKVRGEMFFSNENYSQIFFLPKGVINFQNQNEYQTSNVFEEGTFLMLPKGSKYSMNVVRDSDIVIVNMYDKINFCNHFPLEILYELNKNITQRHSIYPLKINEMIYDYLNTIVKTISDGLKCSYFQELKQKELLFYLRAYYPKKDLVAFFSPILNGDIYFSKLIYENYESAKHVEELAFLTHYSVSGFKKRFTKVFGISPQNWMNREKAKKIYYEINCTQKQFKEIAIEYDFSSPAYFDKFCKKTYGMSPGTLREDTKRKVLFENDF